MDCKGCDEAFVNFLFDARVAARNSSCVMPMSSLSAPVTEPVIVGHENNSVIDLTVGTAITLTCKADYGDPPYVLTWTNQLEVTQETTTVTETTTISMTSTDDVKLSNVTETVEPVTTVSTSANTSIENSAYVTANTTESTYIANETLVQNTDTGVPINETTRIVETIWPNRTRSNTTGWDYKVHRRSVRSMNETGTSYENESTVSVDSVETTTEMLYNTTGWSDRRVSDHEDITTDTTGESTTTAAWMSDVDSTTTECPTYKPEEEPFQVVNSLPGSR